MKRMVVAVTALAISAMVCGNDSGWEPYHTGKLFGGNEFTTEYVGPTVLGASENQSNKIMHLLAVSDMIEGDGLERLRAGFRSISSIAVVGSSGNLLHSQMGAKISQADVIIRANGAHTDGYEADVGGRTSITVAHSWGVEDAERFNVNPKFFAIFTTRGESKSSEQIINSIRQSTEVLSQNLSQASSTASQVAASSPPPEEGAPAAGGSSARVHLKMDWLKHKHDTVLDGIGTFPSAGFIALLFGMELAELAADNGVVVDVYGFGASSCGKYFDCDGTNTEHGSNADVYAQDGYHPFAKEAMVRASWASSGKLRIHQGSLALSKELASSDPQTNTSSNGAHTVANSSSTPEVTSASTTDSNTEPQGPPAHLQKETQKPFNSVLKVLDAFRP